MRCDFTREEFHAALDIAIDLMEQECRAGRRMNIMDAMKIGLVRLNQQRLMQTTSITGVPIISR